MAWILELQKQAEKIDTATNCSEGDEEESDADGNHNNIHNDEPGTSAAAMHGINLLIVKENKNNFFLKK
jgi:hypothetical protein